MAHPTQHFWTYDDLLKLTPLSKNTLLKHVERGSLDPDDIGSVVLWLARHAHPEFQHSILRHALSAHELPDKPKRDRAAARKGK